MSVQLIPGDDQYRGVSIDNALKQRGAWYVMLRTHDHIWNQKNVPLEIRWRASHELWMLCNEVPCKATS